MLVRKLWRAFPELDAYPDKECIAFVKLARSRVLWRLTQLAVVGVVFAGTAVALLLAAGFISQLVQANAQWIPDAVFVALGIGGVIVVPATSIVSAFLARDFLLRRRLRHILRDTGSCTMCGYSLLGLPIPDSLKVNCPECGYLCAVDVSLSVLVRDDAGRDMGRRLIMQQPKLWTPERRRFSLRLCLIVVGGIVTLTGVPLVMWEIWLRYQAAQATAQMPIIDEASALIMQHRPGLEFVCFPAALEIIQQIDTHLSTIESQVRTAEDVPLGLYHDFTCIVPAPLAGQPGSDSTLATSEVRLFTAQYLAASDGHELDSLLAELRAAPRQVRDCRTPTSALVSAPLRYLGPARKLAGFLAARARQAIVRGDTATAELDLATIRTLSTHIGDQPTFVDRLVANSIAALGSECANRWLASRPTADELDAIERAWVSPQDTFDASLTVDYEALMARAAIAEYFADPGNVRLAPVSGLATPLWSNPSANIIKSPGTWASNRDAIERERSRRAQSLTLSLPERLAARNGATTPNFEGAGLAALMLSQGSMSGETIAWMDAAIEAGRCTTTLMLALERYRLQHGDFPATLAELVPEFLPRLPTDPTTGGPLGYRKVEADPLGRSYLIYLFGTDGEDNGGREFDRPLGKGAPVLSNNPMFVITVLAPGTDLQLSIASPILRYAIPAGDASPDAGPDADPNPDR